MYRDMPSLDAILLDPDKAPIPSEPSTQYAVATGLASKVNHSNFGRIATYAERLERAKLGEFAVLLVRDCIRREPKVTATADFIRLSSTALGKMFVGA
jgi:hypothetical protein